MEKKAKLRKARKSRMQNKFFLFLFIGISESLLSSWNKREINGGPEGI